MKKLFMLIASSIFALFVLFVVIEAILIATSGTPVPAPEIDRSIRTLGTGAPLSYVVMGDSTSISQGSDYEDGFAVSSAVHLSETYRVRFSNVGVSGATTKTVLTDQLAAAMKRKPDVVLLAVGANDTTRLTTGSSIKSFLQKITDGLNESNCDVRIVVTRAPAMDSVSRFPWGAKQLMALRTRQVNTAFATVIAQNNLTLAPIAEETREAFLADPTLTAADNFHPNARGYALWKPVINKALDRALAKAPAADCTD